MQTLDPYKNPGLGVRGLHQKGMDGRGRKIAIIDQPLSPDHVEYSDQLREYHVDESMQQQSPQMHGCATASLAVGKTCGTAPGADLIFFAAPAIDEQGQRDCRKYAAIIEELIERPAADRPDVISMSIGWRPEDNGAAEIEAAIQKAHQKNVMIFACSDTDLVSLYGAGRDVATDLDDAAGYSVARLHEGRPLDIEPTAIFVPIDNRAYADYRDDGGYITEEKGGLSWSPPYMAGVYAMAKQIDPLLTPKSFMATVQRTSVDVGGEKTAVPLVSPVQIIAAHQVYAQERQAVFNNAKV